ncbi:MAG: 30S ribosomal protein S9 [Candidatus Diapherotrites archaeon]|nr:30S ribosomal protein S9 [Candidatus Diapherotrites archaeon]
MSKKKGKGSTTKAKKKCAVARARVTKSKTDETKIRINNKPVELIQPIALKRMVYEPIELAGESAKGLDINVTVKGGGFVSQAIAARGAIAKSIVEYRHNDTLKEKMLAYDRLLLVDNPRRVESKKQLGPKARKKKQKSKR